MAELPKFIIAPRVVISYASFWVVVACVMSMNSVSNHALLGDPLTYAQSFGVAGTACFFWMVALPIVAWGGMSFPFFRGRWSMRFFYHCAAAVGFAVTFVLVRLVLEHVAPFARRLPGNSAHLFHVYFLATWGRNLLLYGGVLALAHTWRYYSDYKVEQQVAFGLKEQIAELLSDHKQQPAPVSRYAHQFVLKEQGRVFVVRVEEIDCIKAAGNYVSLQVGSRAHLLRESMRVIEERLDPAQFARIHRSAIVPLNRIREVRTLPGGRYAAVLKNGMQITLGRIGAVHLEALVQRANPFAPIGQ